jgi:hypothetical protein
MEHTILRAICQGHEHAHYPSRYRGASRAHPAPEGAAGRWRWVLPFGIKAIDRHLPEGGLALGALHEVAGGSHGAIDGAAAAL